MCRNALRPEYSGISIRFNSGRARLESAFGVKAQPGTVFILTSRSEEFNAVPASRFVQHGNKLLDLSTRSLSVKFANFADITTELRGRYV